MDAVRMVERCQLRAKEEMEEGRCCVHTLYQVSKTINTTLQQGLQRSEDSNDTGGSDERENWPRCWNCTKLSRNRGRGERSTQDERQPPAIEDRGVFPLVDVHVAYTALEAESSTVLVEVAL